MGEIGFVNCSGIKILDYNIGRLDETCKMSYLSHNNPDRAKKPLSGLSQMDDILVTLGNLLYPTLSRRDETSVYNANLAGSKITLSPNHHPDRVKKPLSGLSQRDDISVTLGNLLYLTLSRRDYALVYNANLTGSKITLSPNHHPDRAKKPLSGLSQRDDTSVTLANSLHLILSRRD